MARVDVEAPFGVFARPDLRIRRMREADLPQVLVIENASFSTPWKEPTFLSLMRRSDTDLFVADSDEGILGYTASWTVIDQSELGNVAVAPAARGQGVGGALVDTVLARVKERGAEECVLEVRESNRSAQQIYHRRGFVVVGRRRSYYSLPTEDALVMKLRLHDET
jgi:ribosomal-protein-alanine N-acetyltransferase